MKIFNLFTKKIKGKDIIFDIKIKSLVPYPTQDIRWKLYGQPLCSIFAQYFDEISVEYFKDKNGNLDEIDIICYGSKFNHKPSDEGEFAANLFRQLSHYVNNFFSDLNIKAEIVGIRKPTDNSMKEYMDSTRRVETGFITSNKKESPTEQTFKPFIAKSIETGKDDLFVPLNKEIDVSDWETKNRTITKTLDGKRYFLGYISKKDGKRYYAQVSNKLGKKIFSMSDKK